jgi:hypothetical protein
MLTQVLMLEFLKSIKVNGEIDYVEFVDLFSFTLKIFCLINVTTTWLFVKSAKKFRMMSKFT